MSNAYQTLYNVSSFSGAENEPLTLDEIDVDKIDFADFKNIDMGEMANVTYDGKPGPIHIEIGPVGLAYKGMSRAEAKKKKAEDKDPDWSISIALEKYPPFKAFAEKFQARYTKHLKNLAKERKAFTDKFDSDDLNAIDTMTDEKFRKRAGIGPFIKNTKTSKDPKTNVEVTEPAPPTCAFKIKNNPKTSLPIIEVYVESPGCGEQLLYRHFDNDKANEQDAEERKLANNHQYPPPAELLPSGKDVIFRWTFRGLFKSSLGVYVSGAVPFAKRMEIARPVAPRFRTKLHNPNPVETSSSSSTVATTDETSNIMADFGVDNQEVSNDESESPSEENVDRKRKRDSEELNEEEQEAKSRKTDETSTSEE